MQALHYKDCELVENSYTPSLLPLLDNDDIFHQQSQIKNIVNKVISLEIYIKNFSIALNICFDHLIANNIYPLNYHVYMGLQKINSKNTEDLMFFEKETLYIVFNGSKQRLGFWGKFSSKDKSYHKMRPILIQLKAYLEEYYECRLDMIQTITKDIKEHI